MKARGFCHILLIVLTILTGCAARRDLVYFSNMPASTTTIGDEPNQEVHIRKNDIVDVNMTSLNPETDVLFANNKNFSTFPILKRDGYRVNSDGYINLPVIGDFKIEGMTVEEAERAIEEVLSKNVKRPTVSVQLLNFKITVIGEVNKPSTFTITDEKVNVLEALGMAGDMTVYGKRQNVLIIRTENNVKTMKRLDLNKKEVFDSPYFYLRQNDIVYVEPDKSKAVEYSQNTRQMPIIIATISAVSVLAAVLLKR
jgi:polysaccharide export outer membrane protein